MRLSLFEKIRSWPASRWDDTVMKDADALLKEWGDAACDRATYLSWEEDFGLVAAPVAGHWWRVREEVARRLEQGETRPRQAVVA